jgi:hypothetical protein
MNLDDFFYNDQSHSFQPKVKIEPKEEKKMHPRGWYIKLADGTLEGTFLSEDRAQKYLITDARDKNPKYVKAEVVFVA